MSTPIGSIEFLVKFDTLSNSFKDAMIGAINDSDLDFDTSKLDDIKTAVDYIEWNVRTRLRTPFSGDYGQFLAAAPGQISWLQEEETIKALTAKLLKWKGDKPLLPKREGEESEEYRARIREVAELILNRAAGEIVNALDEDFGRQTFMKDPQRFIHFQNLIQEAIDGKLAYLIKEVVKKEIPETEVKSVFKQYMKDMGAKMYPDEKDFWRITTQIGLGEEGKVLGKGLGGFLDVMKELGISKEAWEAIGQLDPGKIRAAPTSLREFSESLYKEYTIPVGSIIPNIVTNLMLDIAKKGGTDLGTITNVASATGRVRTDILGDILESEAEKLFEDLPERMEGKFAEELIADFKKYFTALHGWAPITAEMARVFTEAKAYGEELTGRPARGLRAAPLGGADYLITILDRFQKIFIPDPDELADPQEQMKRDFFIIAEELKKVALGMATGDDIEEQTDKLTEIIEAMESSGEDEDL